MSTAAGGIALAPFDDPPQSTLDVALWQRNLDALRAVDAPSAASLEAIALPAAWRPVRALDDEPTWRLEPAGAPPQWLAGTAVPQRRAAALLERYETGGLNATLPGIGAGAELMLLLDALAAHASVYVFEGDWRLLAAVLRGRDLADALRQRRCVFVPPADPAAWLQTLLTSNAGLLPPGNILRPPDATDAQVEAVRGVIEHVNRTIGALRQARMSALEAALPLVAPRAASGAPPRLALVALAPDMRSQAAAQALAAAAERQGWPTLLTRVSGPLEAHVLVHAERLAAFGPSATLAVGHGRGALPAALGGRWCQWYLSAADVPERVAADDAVWLAASPTVASALRTAGAPDTQVRPLYWACEPAASPAPAAELGTDVLVLADLPADAASAYDVHLPTHKRLWEQLRRVLAEQWAAPRPLPADGVLRPAEQASNAKLREPALRQRFLRLIESALRPAATLRHVCTALLAAGQRVAVAGRGWEVAEVGSVAIWGANGDAVVGDSATPMPRAVVIAGRADPLGPDVLAAAARGWPLVFHTPHGAGPLAAALGGVLAPEEHVGVYRDARTLVTAVVADARTVLKRAQRAAVHVRGAHSYAQRLAAAAVWLSGEPTDKRD